MDDVLHVLNLGTLKDSAGSALVDMLEERELQRPNEETDVCLKRLWLELRRFAKKRKMECSSRRLSMQRLGREVARRFPSVESAVKGAHMCAPKFAPRIH